MFLLQLYRESTVYLRFNDDKSLHNQQKTFLHILFPHYDLSKVIFLKVQSQFGFNECGVFAIAFAVSLVTNIKPESVEYEYRLLRPHLLKILKNHQLEHSPRKTYNVETASLTKHPNSRIEDESSNSLDSNLFDAKNSMNLTFNDSQDINFVDSSQSSYGHMIENVQCVCSDSQQTIKSDTFAEENQSFTSDSIIRLKRKRRYSVVCNKYVCFEEETSSLRTREKAKIRQRKFRQKNVFQ